MKSLAALGLVPVACGREPASVAETLWVSAEGDPASGTSLVAVDPAGDLLLRVPSSFRGHGLAVHPTRPKSVVMVGRRPGELGIEVDLGSARIRRRFAVEPGRQLQGHACFDASRLYTTEADLRTGMGKIGVRDADTYAFLFEIESGGLGPHELALMPDGQTLVVANGGLVETPGGVANLDTMASSLAYVDLPEGRVVETLHFPEEKASLRHLAVANDGTVVVGAQVQRRALDHDDVVPLAAVHRRGEPLRVLEGPTPLIAAMRDYVGSVAVSDATRQAGFTSPRGNLVLFWNIDTGELAGHHRLADVCGLCAPAGGSRFVMTSSLGHVRVLEAPGLLEIEAHRETFEDIQWDNHMVAVEALT